MAHVLTYVTLLTLRYLLTYLNIHESGADG